MSIQKTSSHLSPRNIYEPAFHSVLLFHLRPLIPTIIHSLFLIKMFSPRVLLLFTILPAVLCAPTPTNVLEPRASQCGQWDSIATGDFTLYADLWGESAGTGSQCSTVSSASGTSINWSTSWSWSGGSSSVKSYTNAVYNTASIQLSTISSMPTSWKWR